MLLAISAMLFSRTAGTWLQSPGRNLRFLHFSPQFSLSGELLSFFISSRSEDGGWGLVPRQGLGQSPQRSLFYFPSDDGPKPCGSSSESGARSTWPSHVTRTSSPGANS